MSSEYLSRIYDSFSREERTTVNTIQGTGLGMSIVKSLVDLMGGSISVDSIQGKGTQFVVVLDFKISDLTILADYFIIASGNSSTQTRTLAEEVEYQMSQAGVEPNRKEGYNGSNWVILDYGDIVVHIFYKETRDYYQLERLWADGEKIDIEEYVIEE